MKVNKAQPVINSLAIKVLSAVGNPKPTVRQIKMLESLLSSVFLRQHLLFNQQLTQQEVACLLLAAQGNTSGQIAQLLQIKKSTVESHRKEILRKLECKNIAQAVFEGIRYGFIPPKVNPFPIQQFYPGVLL